MNNIIMNSQDIDLPVWAEQAEKFALKVLDEIKRDNWELSILFCGNKTIKELNSKYRKKRKPTDILSFSMGETVTCENGKMETTVYLPGDIVISLETLRENAKKFQITEDEELRRLIIHGILHLDGMSHETNDKQEPMLAFQEQLLARLGSEQIITAAEETRGKK